MEWNVESLNALFDIEDGLETIELSESDLEAISWSNFSRKGAKHTEDAKEAISANCRGHRWSDADKERIRQQVTGRWDSYSDEKKDSIRQKLKENHSGGASGDRNAKSIGWRIYHKCGKITEMVGISKWAKSNGYVPSHIIAVREGTRKRHKDIIKVEKLNKE